jgi:hypothetical protein
VQLDRGRAAGRDKRLFPQPVDASGALVDPLVFDRSGAVR